MPRRTAASPLGERMAALAAEDAAVLVASLVQAPRDPRGVHEARKAVRRLRSLLALAHDALGKPVRPLDRQLRALAKGLSALRDAQVVVDTASLMADDSDDADEIQAWHRIRDALAQRHASLLHDTLQKDPGFARRQTQAHRHAEQLQQLPWHQVHRGRLRHALEKSAQRQQHAQQVALASGRVDDLHDWRRRTRRLRMQFHAMRKLEVRLDAHAMRHLPTPGKDIAALVDQLGALQDLALLQRALRSLERQRAPVPAGADRRRTAPRERILPLA